jgi:PleD family two-component response regulator
MPTAAPTAIASPRVPGTSDSRTDVTDCAAFGEIGQEAGKKRMGINETASAVAHHERGHHVLIADDDRAIREPLAQTLESERYVVTVVLRRASCGCSTT